MYVYQKENADRKIMNAEGRYFGGVPIGIILFGVAGYTLPPGSVENATSFKYPVHYKAIPAASIKNVVQPEPHPEVLEQLIEAGKEMELQGCRAIIGACGYFGNYLPMVKKALKVPCFFSSLMQLPLILNSIPEDKKVGVICANGNVLPKSNVLKNCGVFDTSRLVIRGGGGPDVPEMTNESRMIPSRSLKPLELAPSRKVSESIPKFPCKQHPLRAQAPITPNTGQALVKRGLSLVWGTTCR